MSVAAKVVYKQQDNESGALRITATHAYERFLLSSFSGFCSVFAFFEQVVV
jgi:hypothetical protein